VLLRLVWAEVVGLLPGPAGEARPPVLRPERAVHVRSAPALHPALGSLWPPDPRGASPAGDVLV